MLIDRSRKNQWRRRRRRRRRRLRRSRSRTGRYRWFGATPLVGGSRPMEGPAMGVPWSGASALPIGRNGAAEGGRAAERRRRRRLRRRRRRCRRRRWRRRRRRRRWRKPRRMAAASRAIVEWRLLCSRVVWSRALDSPPATERAASQPDSQPADQFSYTQSHPKHGDDVRVLLYGLDSSQTDRRCGPRTSFLFVAGRRSDFLLHVDRLSTATAAAKKVLCCELRSLLKSGREFNCSQRHTEQNHRVKCHASFRRLRST